MIVRTVTMQFREGEVDSFLEIFHQYKSKIRGSKGCSFLALIKSTTNPLEISTLSHWDAENSLNEYRYSDTFKEVWPKTKALFSTSPKAKSYHILTIVE